MSSVSKHASKQNQFSFLIKQQIPVSEKKNKDRARQRIYIRINISN